MKSTSPSSRMLREKQPGFQPVKILTRPKLVAQCLSCFHSFTSTSELASHLRTPSGTILCSETKAKAIVGCFECKTSFTQLDNLVSHIEDPSAHSPFEAKPTGRTVFIGGFGGGVTEKDVKEFFDGFIIETTSMLTHRDANEKFAFIDFSTKEEVDRAVKRLHGKQLLGRRVIIQPQRSDRNQQTGHRLKQSKVKQGISNSQPKVKEITNNSQTKIKNINSPKSKVKRNTVNLQTKVEEKAKMPRQPAQTGNKAPTTPLRGSAARFNPLITRAAPQSVQMTQESHHSPNSSNVSHPGQSNWINLNQDEMIQAQAALSNNIHTTSRLFEAGFNIATPIMPLHSELQAKVKCKHCRNTRRYNDGKTNKDCINSPDLQHSYGGFSHLTSRYEGFTQTPTHDPSHPKRLAVALDCEMAGGWTGDSFIDNVIQLTATDYFTGGTLISSLVAPTHQIRQWCTSIHGVTRNEINTAIYAGTALQGWEGARAALFAHIDDATILVGHALHNDLNILHIAHSRIVDSEILAHAAVGLQGFKHHSLKLLCKEYLGREIQVRVHDCLEDTLAARELVLWMTMHPESVREWGAGVRAREEERLRLKEEAEVSAAMAALAAEAGATEGWEM